MCGWYQKKFFDIPYLYKSDRAVEILGYGKFEYNQISFTFYKRCEYQNVDSLFGPEGQEWADIVHFSLDLIEILRYYKF